MPRVRLDQLLVDRGLAPSRAAAQAMVLAGEVELEGGGRSLKPGNLVALDAAVTVRQRPRWASRAGDKLEAALDAFGVDVAGRTAMDAGASTGGFTDVLLSRGAARVYAVDVGRGQLIDRLAAATRGSSPWSGPTCARWSGLPEPIDLATLDLSFISLRLVLPVVGGCFAQEAPWSRWSSPSSRPARRRSRAAAWSAIRPPTRPCCDRLPWTRPEAGFGLDGLMRSPVTGSDGNVEFLAHLGSRPGRRRRRWSR